MKRFYARALMGLSFVWAAAMAIGNPYPLFAGQHTLVGDVTVTHDAVNLYVTYSITQPNWLLKEVQLHVAGNPMGIPQKNGNPTPGKFAYKAVFNPLVSTANFVVPRQTAWSNVAIAAHAVVWNVFTLTETSMVGDWVYGPTLIDPHNGYLNPAGPFNPVLWGSVSNATMAINDIADLDRVWNVQHRRLPPFYPVGRPLVDIPYMGGWIDWIATNPDAEFWNNNTWRYFVKPYTVPGTPLGARLHINADNIYWAYSNKVELGWDANFLHPGIDTYTFMPNPGANTLDVIVRNIWQPGPQVNNPTGLTYLLEVDYSMGDETAWGGGEAFSGANWATYFTYMLTP